ncbi:MAG TPA: ATP-binding protein, partial [Candidatus Limnocylindrales bacterium]|nr:ATP-binding protein [Candidatus Limnocylindrales bacterium]
LLAILVLTVVSVTAYAALRRGWGRGAPSGYRASETAVAPTPSGDAASAVRSSDGELFGDLSELADQIDAGIVRMDDALSVVMANQAAARLLDRQRGVLVGRSAMEAFVDHRVEGVARAARERGSATTEVSVGGASERTVIVRARRGLTGGVWLILEDVTDLRRLQRIRTEFIDNLSHELRTPLTTIRLLTETLAADLETADVSSRIRDRVQKIDVETGHLVQMVNELLDLSRIEGGATHLQMDAVDLESVIRGAIDRLRTFADRQQVSLDAELPEDGDLPLVRGDDERLGQLLINLLHNAVKFSPRSARVVVTARREGPEVIVNVRDEGAGIPRADLGRIFERFYKVDKARVRGAAGGTGLGLSIARHIAEGHGGRIWVESEEGSGSVFSFAIPILDDGVRGEPVADPPRE